MRTENESLERVFYALVYFVRRKTTLMAKLSFVYIWKGTMVEGQKGPMSEKEKRDMNGEKKPLLSGRRSSQEKGGGLLQKSD